MKWFRLCQLLLWFSRARWLCRRPGPVLCTRHRRHRRLRLLRHRVRIWRVVLAFSADGLSSSVLADREIRVADLRRGLRVARVVGIRISSKGKAELRVSSPVVLVPSIRLVLVL